MKALKLVLVWLVSLVFVSCASDSFSPSTSPAPSDQSRDREKKDSGSPSEPEGPPDQHFAPQTWKVAVISDLNKSYGSTTYRPELHAAITHIKSAKVSLVLSTGDMVAGQKSGLNYQAMWNSFHQSVTEPLGDTLVPLLPSPGNHDASTGSSFQHERSLYKQNFEKFPVDRFNHLKDQSSRVQFLRNVEQNYPLNYAVTMGPAVFIALDATAVGPLIKDQLGWLEEVLESASAYHIKVVFGHMPLYPFTFNKASEYIGRGTGKSGYALRMEALLEKHKVDYFLSGHHHAFYPGQRRGSVRYVSVPLLGSGRRVLLTKNRSFKKLSDEAFLYLTFNERGEHSLVALSSPSMTPISWSGLPSSISVPARSSSDCKDCGVFPSSFFLDSGLRTLFRRIQ